MTRRGTTHQVTCTQAPANGRVNTAACRLGLTVVLFTCGVILLSALTAATASDPQQEQASSALSTPLPVDDAVVYEYVGTKKCRMCHSKWYRSWLESPKAHSWEALKPGVSIQVKQNAGLDVTVDYTTDGRCLKCHTVGYGQPGGYAIPSSDDPRSQRQAKTRQGARCESCHGPGSGFVKIMQDVARSERTYDPAEVRAAGRVVVTREVCTRCHSTEAMCMTGVSRQAADGRDQSWLHVDVDDRRGFHAEFPLKYRVTNGSEGHSNKQGHTR